MKGLKKIVVVTLAFIMFATMNALAQKGGHHGGGHHGGGHHGAKVMGPHPHGPHPGAKVIVKKSMYRPAKIVVWHPYWGPKYAFNHRWVFFPRYNFYWDNWRNHYVFWNGTIWVSNPSPPPAIVNININNEKHYEMKDSDDDDDDIYKTNDTHKTEYKPE
jgi:hypothetical protein